MSKNRLSVITAVALVVFSLAVFIGRQVTFGTDSVRLRGASFWKVTMVASGELPSAATTVTTLQPPDFRRQHIYEERPSSEDLRVSTSKKSARTGRLELTWRRISIPLVPGPQPFRLNYSFRCVLGVYRPTSGMNHLTHELDAAPKQGTLLQPAPRIESDHKDISKLARDLCDEGMAPLDQVRAFFDYVSKLGDEPTMGSRSARECLVAESGDSGGKSRLLVALCRNRGIQARVVTGLILSGDREQGLHRWVEAWVNDHWLAACPTYRHFGTRQLPINYLVLGVGDDEPIRGSGRQTQYGFVVHSLQDPIADDGVPYSGIRAFWLRLSFYNLKPAEQHLVRFLLLLPVSALIVSIFRTLIGVPTYGTFSPALLGLAFADFRALPWALGIFLVVVIIGWLMRHLLDRFHLLLVPRTAILLTLIIIFLIIVTMVAGHNNVPVTQYVALFPLVILTHLVERFWTVEAEDGTRAAFRILAGTLFVAASISLSLGPDIVGLWLFRHPEALGLVLAAQFLLGRYTGYRLSELYRFQDLIHDEHLPEAKP
jgi:transglutaminase-like putative cysteine protease